MRQFWISEVSFSTSKSEMSFYSEKDKQVISNESMVDIHLPKLDVKWIESSNQPKATGVLA